MSLPRRAPTFPLVCRQMHPSQVHVHRYGHYCHGKRLTYPGNYTGPYRPRVHYSPPQVSDQSTTMIFLSSVSLTISFPEFHERSQWHVRRCKRYLAFVLPIRRHRHRCWKPTLGSCCEYIQNICIKLATCTDPSHRLRPIFTTGRTKRSPYGHQTITPTSSPDHLLSIRTTPPVSSQTRTTVS